MAKRYIDAERIDFSPLIDDFDRARAKVIIMGQPTADVVEVVWCSECEYGNKATINDKGFKICPVSGMEITDNDYCSYGERRTDDDGNL